MQDSPRKLWTLLWFSAIGTLGHPASFLLLLSAVAGTLVLPLFQFQRFSEDGRLARDCGLATALMLGFILAIGAAGRLRNTLQNGTCTLALTKPLSREIWFFGNLCGAWAAVAFGLCTQGAAVLLAEAWSPQYHTTGAYAHVSGILQGLGGLILVLVAAALNNRFRNGRFALTATLLLPVSLWGFVIVQPAIHWGVLSALLAIGLNLLQLTTFAYVAVVWLPIGVTAGITACWLIISLLFLGGAAFLPLDFLARGGSVPLYTLLGLLPQTFCVTLLLLWFGRISLNWREI